MIAILICDFSSITLSANCINAMILVLSVGFILVQKPFRLASRQIHTVLGKPPLSGLRFHIFQDLSVQNCSPVSLFFYFCRFRRNFISTGKIIFVPHYRVRLCLWDLWRAEKILIKQIMIILSML